MNVQFPRVDELIVETDLERWCFERHGNECYDDLVQGIVVRVGLWVFRLKGHSREEVVGGLL